jgi:hypothetical protein
MAQRLPSRRAALARERFRFVSHDGQRYTCSWSNREQRLLEAAYVEAFPLKLMRHFSDSHIAIAAAVARQPAQGMLPICIAHLIVSSGSWGKIN